jgi:acyl phosphate:glycerol-3-phosphate acyltransferase
MNNLINFLNENLWFSAIICSITAYLIGSLSVARMVYSLVKKSKNYEPFRQPIPGTDEHFDSDLISATWVTTKLGKKYGCITSISDMIKVGVPTLVTKLLITSNPIFLLTAFFGILGHNYPIYYRFVGGRGESPIIGSLLVINWFGIIIANLASAVLGFITGSILVLRWGWYVLLIFWFWYYFKDIYFVLFMVGVNFLFWFSMRKDLKKYIEVKTKYKDFTIKEEDVSDFILMGRKMGKMMDNYSVYAILKRAFFKKNN